MDYRIIHSDCMDAMRELIAEGMQVDSIVTDPPYGIRFMGMAWDTIDINKPAREAYKRYSPGSDLERLGKNANAGTYDLSLKGMSAFQEWTREWASLAIQILKPGGHLLCFASPRTYHRMASGIEDAGFDIRDQLMWVFGSGFPKSLNIAKAIDKQQGVEVEEYKLNPRRHYREETRTTEAAKQWQGFGTALKPAHEPIVLARKPISEKTIAENVLKHGTGAINVDGCRVGNNGGWKVTVSGDRETAKDFATSADAVPINKGRFPANLIHDGSDEVMNAFPTVEGSHLNKNGTEWKVNSPVMKIGIKERIPFGYADKGSAARFFYCAKASKKDRNGSKHPTVKPLQLMRYLCRLITPPVVFECELCNNRPHEKSKEKTSTASAVRTMPEGFQAERQPEKTTVLFENMSVSINENSSSSPMREVQKDFYPSETGQESTEILLEELREQSSGAEPPVKQGNDNAERLPNSVHSGTSYGNKGRNDIRTQDDNGQTSGANVNEPGDSASQERNQGRQSNRELGSSGQEIPRFNTEATSKADSVSALFENDKSFRPCPTCGKNLKARKGIILDPFAGSGTTGQAAIEEGFKPILIEREQEYITDIERRLNGNQDQRIDQLNFNESLLK